MIELDFRLVSAYLRVCIQNMAWSGLFTEPPSLPNWDRYCASVAPELSKEDWVVLVQAATGAVGTNFKRQFQKAQERTNKAIGEEELAWLRTAIVEPINKARDILLRLAGSETIELQEDSVTEGEDMDREERG